MSADAATETAAETRRYPARPIVGVAGAVVAEGKVLLIRRGSEPMRGEWSLPGGALETGETMLEGVTREVLEETGLRVKPLELLAMLDRISRDESGAVEFHYVLLDWLCELAETTQMDEAQAGSDALEIAWMSEETLLAMTEMDDASRRVSLDALKRMEARG